MKKRKNDETTSTTTAATAATIHYEDTMEDEDEDEDEDQVERGKRQRVFQEVVKGGCELYGTVEQGDSEGKITFSCFSKRQLTDIEAGDNSTSSLCVGLRSNAKDRLRMAFQLHAPSLLNVLQSSSLSKNNDNNSSSLSTPTWYRITIQNTDFQNASILKGVVYDLQSGVGADVFLLLQQILDAPLSQQLTSLVFPFYSILLKSS